MPNMPDVNKKGMHVSLPLAMYKNVLNYADLWNETPTDVIRHCIKECIGESATSPKDRKWVKEQVNINLLKREAKRKNKYS